MSVYTSSVAPQLAAFQREVAAVTRRVLLGGGRRFRSRMMRERLSGPPGVYRKSGRLQRSLMYKVWAGPGESALRASIGGNIAYYAAQHEASGKLGFRRVFIEECKLTVDELRMALRFVASQASQSVGAAAAIAGVALEEIGGLSAADTAREASWAKERFDPKTRFGQKNLQGKARWQKATMEQFAAKSAAMKPRAGESDAGKIDWAKGRKIMDAARAAKYKPPKLGTWKTIVEHRAPKPRKWRW